MVFTADVPAALRQLEAIYRKLCALHEWEKLAIEELKPGAVPAFDPHTSQLNDIRCEASGLVDYFSMLAGDVSAVLRRPDLVCTTEERLAWQRQLSRLDRKMAAAHAGARFIKP